MIFLYYVSLDAEKAKKLKKIEKKRNYRKKVLTINSFIVIL